MKEWISSYVAAQRAILDQVPTEKVEELVGVLQQALQQDRQIFVFGNGGSAANAAHFVTDLGKGSSDKIGRRFRCMTLNDNVSWMTAIGNDYSYDDVFVRQLENFAKPGDVAMTMSVSGNSPNCVKAIGWAADKGLETIALVGGKRGRLAELAKHVLVVDSHHYGRVEDTHMLICHLLCYVFMEKPEVAAAAA